MARILMEGGGTNAEIQPLDVTCKLPETALVRYVTPLGPVGPSVPGS